MMRYLTTTLWENRDMFLLGIIIGMVSVMLAGCAQDKRAMDWGAVADAYGQSQKVTKP